MPGGVALDWERAAFEAAPKVAAGQALFRPQAMKMEFEAAVPRAGRLVEVNAREGEAVEANDVMARVDTTTRTEARFVGARDEHAGDGAHAI